MCFAALFGIKTVLVLEIICYVCSQIALKTTSQIRRRLPTTENKPLVFRNTNLVLVVLRHTIGLLAAVQADYRPLLLAATTSYVSTANHSRFYYCCFI